MINFTEAQLNQLYQYALVLCDQPADAYDLLQTSLEQYLPKRAQVDDPMAYVRRTIRNRWIDTHRKEVIRENYENSPPDIAESTLENIVIQQDLLKKIWQQLGSEERELLYYWAVLECSVTEISQELGIPRGTLLSRLHRMRKRIEEQSNPLAGGVL